MSWTQWKAILRFNRWCKNETIVSVRLQASSCHRKDKDIPRTDSFLSPCFRFLNPLLLRLMDPSCFLWGRIREKWNLASCSSRFYPQISVPKPAQAYTVAAEFWLRCAYIHFLRKQIWRGFDRSDWVGGAVAMATCMNGLRELPSAKKQYNSELIVLCSLNCATNN